MSSYVVADDRYMAQEAERLEKLQEDKSKEVGKVNVFAFSMPKNRNETKAILLATKPVVFNVHNISYLHNGKQRFEFVVCKGDGCPLCNDGKQPVWRAGYPILDLTPWVDKNGIERVGNTIRPIFRGFSDISLFSREIAEYMPQTINKDEVSEPNYRKALMRINKDGKGVQTRYSIRFLTREEIESTALELVDKFLEHYQYKGENYVIEWLENHEQKTNKILKDFPLIDNKININAPSATTEQVSSSQSYADDDDLPF